MLGLPVGDNMRCKLLLGLAVMVASFSNPMVALTRSRKQHDELVAIFGKIDPLAWPPVNDVFTHAVKPLDA